MSSSAHSAARISPGRTIDIATGGSTDDDEGANVGDTPKVRIVYVDRFVAPNGAAKTSDIELNDVSIEDEEAGATELEATIVVFNGLASDAVQAMPEYTPSGLVDGQGLALFRDDESDISVLVIFDGDETDGRATDLIYAKEVAGETPQSSSGGACSAGFGAAALAALAALAVMPSRRR